MTRVSTGTPAACPYLSPLLFVVAASFGFVNPATAQDHQPTVATQPSHRLAVELGAVMGVIGLPYVVGGVAVGRWSVHASAATWRNDCNGVQVNAGTIVGGDASATHTLGGMWGRFRNDCWYSRPALQDTRGQYFGFVYNFQVRGFFLEVAPLVFGDDNPFWGGDFGPLSRVYGQVGYVYRFAPK